MCCKLPSIQALDKPADKWCKWCKPGQGRCMIYDVRPAPCKLFNCEWLLRTEFDDLWYPPTAKMILATSDAMGAYGLKFMNVMVDLGSPNRWREAPYYGRLKQMAQIGMRHKVLVRVQVGNRSWIVLPHTDTEIPDDAKGFDVVQNALGLWNLKFLR